MRPQRTRFVVGDSQHEAFLTELWELLITGPFERVSSRWSEIGFQGKDPATDFRGQGLLGVQNLYHFSREYKAQAVEILARDHGSSFLRRVSGQRDVFFLVCVHYHMSHDDGHDVITLIDAVLAFCVPIRWISLRTCCNQHIGTPNKAAKRAPWGYRQFTFPGMVIRPLIHPLLLSAPDPVASLTHALSFSSRAAGLLTHTLSSFRPAAPLTYAASVVALCCVVPRCCMLPTRLLFFLF